jgi:hypothetical protein
MSGRLLGPRKKGPSSLPKLRAELRNSGFRHAAAVADRPPGTKTYPACCEGAIDTEDGRCPHHFNIPRTGSPLGPQMDPLLTGAAGLTGAAACGIRRRCESKTALSSKCPGAAPPALEATVSLFALGPRQYNPELASAAEKRKPRFRDRQPGLISRRWLTTKARYTMRDIHRLT